MVSTTLDAESEWEMVGKGEGQRGNAAVGGTAEKLPKSSFGDQMAQPTTNLSQNGVENKAQKVCVEERCATQIELLGKLNPYHWHRARGPPPHAHCTTGQSRFEVSQSKGLHCSTPHPLYSSWDILYSSQLRKGDFGLGMVSLDQQRSYFTPPWSFCFVTAPGDRDRSSHCQSAVGYP